MLKSRKVGWLDKGRRGFHESWGNGVKYLKREWNKKRRGETKYLKKEGKLSQEVGVVNGGEGGLELFYKLSQSLKLKEVTGS